MKTKYLPLIATIGFMASCQTEADYDATGIFETTKITISAETSGKIIEMDLEEGDSVTANQLIALVDTTIFSLQTSQISTQRGAAETASPDIQAQAAALRSQIEHQRHEVARYESLLADGATTQKVYDDARAQLQTLQGQLQALLSTLNKNRSSIAGNSDAMRIQQQQVMEQIEKCKITCPISGTVLTKYSHKGEYAMPGKPIIEVANLENMYLMSYFTVSQLADIKIGQKVTVIADFGDKQFEYPGTITWIAQESQFTPKSIQTADTRANLVYAVKITVKNDGRLKLGQYGEVRL